MADRRNHIAYIGVDRGPSGGTAVEAVRAAVVIVRVVAVALALGVTLSGLNTQPAREGNPEHAKVIELENEPCGVTVKVTSTELPADTVGASGVDERAKLFVVVETTKLTVVLADVVPEVPVTVIWVAPAAILVV